MYRYVIAELPDEHELYVNLIVSQAGRYLSRQPHVFSLIKEALVPLNFSASKMSFEYDLGRIIGNTDIVDTTIKDTIYYAKAYKKNNFSRYAKNRYPAPSTKLTIILQRDPTGDYEITDTWIGPHCPPFPGEDHETVKSKSYWETHALVHDSQVVQSKTITKVCPF